MEWARFPPLLFQLGVFRSEHCTYTQAWQTHKSEQRAGLYIQISVVGAGAGKDGELAESDTPQPAQRTKTAKNLSWGRKKRFLS